MSSILDALRKVEADERRRPIRLPPAPPRSRGRLAALMAAAAFVAGAGVVALVVGLRPGAPLVETAAPTPPAPAPAAPPAAAPTPAAPPTAAPLVPPTAEAPAPTEAPAANVEEPTGEEDIESDVPDQITILRPSHEPAPQAEVQVEALPMPAPAEPAVDVLPGPPVGAPEIRVSFLIYSAVPERRQVSLTIDNGPLVTLHEGQNAGSISLVRILRDRIHVEHGGRTFSVRAVL